MDAVLYFVESRPGLIGLGAGLSVLMFVGTLVLAPILLAHMRPDYFVGEHPPADRWTARHGALGVLVRIVKNLGGAVLLVLGLVMLVLPGQGILTILMGLALLEFPGKRRVERWLIRRKGVRSGVDWIRTKAGREPLVVEKGSPSAEVARSQAVSESEEDPDRSGAAGSAEARPR